MGPMPLAIILIVLGVVAAVYADGLIGALLVVAGLALIFTGRA